MIRWQPTTLAAVVILLWASLASSSLAGNALGPRIGLSGGDDLFFGVQGEFGPALGKATIVPSLDFGDGSSNIANLDLRYYLLHIPETGIRFYCSAGPSLQFSGDSELGLSLTLGVHIPMQGDRRYNLEYRWGLGDIPDHKIGLAVMFGL